MLKHLSCYPGDLVNVAIAGIIMIVVATYFPNKQGTPAIVFFIAAGLFFIVQTYFHFIGARVRFIYGDINPGIIVKKNLVAVLTNLGIDGRDYYALKILAQPVRKMTGGAGEPGERVAAACQYVGSLSANHWRDFDFELVQCATRNEATIERVMRSIPEEEWQALEDAVASIEGRLWSGRLIPLEVR